MVEVNWRRAATAIGVVAFFATGRIVRAIPVAGGAWFIPLFLTVSAVLIGIATLWLVPNSRRQR